MLMTDWTKKKIPQFTQRLLSLLATKNSLELSSKFQTRTSKLLSVSQTPFFKANSSCLKMEEKCNLQLYGTWSIIKMAVSLKKAQTAPAQCKSGPIHPHTTCRLSGRTRMTTKMTWASLDKWSSPKLRHNEQAAITTIAWIIPSTPKLTWCNKSSIGSK